MLTLVTVTLFTLSGLIQLPPAWNSLPCEELYEFYDSIRQRHGGNLEFSCERFAPLHEADLELDPDMIILEEPYTP